MEPPWIILHMQVKLMRFLMSIGMFIHRMGAPRPIEPCSSIRIPIREPGKGKEAEIELLFYAPQSHSEKTFSRGQANFLNQGGSKGYCAIVNFHGGGFTLGQPSDDARWATTAVQSLGAVVISVEYRLAPEHPFPAAVKDAVDALEWIINHAQQLRINKSKIALSGFSAGGNICLAALLAWRDKFHTAASSSFSNSPYTLSPVSALSSFYPPADFTLTRAQRRATNPGGASKSLSSFLTTMFDRSYLPLQSSSLSTRTSKHLDLTDPYISPALVNDEVLIQALPQDIFLYTCEWDSLFVEGIWEKSSRQEGRKGEAWLG